MEQNRNYQRELDKIIDDIVKADTVPSLLLHSCCAPCSSYVLEYLSTYFKITVLYYNPNIYPEREYYKRVEEQKELIQNRNTVHKIDFMEGNYNTELFYQTIKGYEKEPEGGDRCFLCYEMRLKEAAVCAKEYEFDFFTTTLSISPYKNAKKINEIGEKLANEYGVRYLFSDFKKKNGYKRSIELSNDYGLYRQDYCGCVFSKREKERLKEDKK